MKAAGPRAPSPDRLGCSPISPAQPRSANRLAAQVLRRLRLCESDGAVGAASTALSAASRAYCDHQGDKKPSAGVAGTLRVPAKPPAWWTSAVRDERAARPLVHSVPVAIACRLAFHAQRLSVDR